VAWERRANRVAGVTLLALPILSVVGFAAAGPIAEIDPFARGDIEGLLRAIYERPGLFSVSLVPFVVMDVLALPAVATVLYLSFRDRSHFLALLGALGMVVGAAGFILHEAGAMTLPFLAADFFAEGGAPGVTIGDPSILQAARTVSIVQGVTALCGQSGMGVGVGAIGVLIVRAPNGKWNPPKWLGVLGIVAAAGMVSTWLFLVNHTAGGIATLVAETATILMVIILGIWFLRQPVEAIRSSVSP
jgi:hypothetical protein